VKNTNGDLPSASHILCLGSSIPRTAPSLFLTGRSQHFVATFPTKIRMYLHSKIKPFLEDLKDSDWYTMRLGLCSCQSILDRYTPILVPDESQEQSKILCCELHSFRFFFISAIMYKTSLLFDIILPHASHRHRHPQFPDNILLLKPGAASVTDARLSPTDCSVRVYL